MSEDLPEIELISLVSDSLPQYKLRADTVTDFTNYRHKDWGINQPPLVTAQELQLSNEQITEVFKYFSKYLFDHLSIIVISESYTSMIMANSTVLLQIMIFRYVV